MQLIESWGTTRPFQNIDKYNRISSPGSWFTWTLEHYLAKKFVVLRHIVMYTYTFFLCILFITFLSLITNQTEPLMCGNRFRLISHACAVIWNSFILLEALEQCIPNTWQIYVCLDMQCVKCIRLAFNTLWKQSRIWKMHQITDWSVNQYLKFKYVKIVTMHFSCGVNEAEAETKK